MGRERPSARGGRGAGNPSAYCIGQAGRAAPASMRSRSSRAPTDRGFHVAPVHRHARFQLRTQLKSLQFCTGSRGVARQISTISGPRPQVFDERLPGRVSGRPDSSKSEIRCPGRFHRFQRIRTIRFTLSTAGLYDLHTRYGQSVDKKALLPGSGNYPQVPPQPEAPLYRGFHPHKFLLNHADNTFLHEIWLYHHHHALDLYPDLEARLGSICPD